jgi:outer membrane protein
LSIAKSARLPKLDINASYGYNRTADDVHITLDDANLTIRAGASLSFNLFNGFKTRTQIQNAQIEHENQRLLENEARLELEKEIANAFEAYQNSRFVLELEEKNLRAADLNFTRTEELFNLGQVTNTQFREAQLNLIRAKTSISSAKFNAKLKEIELLRLSGQLVAPDST